MKKKDFLATLKAMPDCEEKDKLLKSMEEEGVEDDDDDGDPDDSMEKSLRADGLSKALDELERLQGAGAPAIAPLGARMGESADVSLAKSMDATGFVKSLVEQVAAHSDDLGAAVSEISQQQGVNNTAMLATGKLVLSLVKSLQDREAERDAKIDALLAAVNAPAQPRTVTGTRPMSKSFNAGGAGPDRPQGLSKSQLANLMNDELKKSVDAGDHGRAHQISEGVALLLAGRKNGIAAEIEQSHLRKAQA
jgi:hypothetical protein